MLEALDPEPVNPQPYNRPLTPNIKGSEQLAALKVEPVRLLDNAYPTSLRGRRISCRITTAPA